MRTRTLFATAGLIGALATTTMVLTPLAGATTREPVRSGAVVRTLDQLVAETPTVPTQQPLPREICDHLSDIERRLLCPDDIVDPSTGRPVPASVGSLSAGAGGTTMSGTWLDIALEIAAELLDGDDPGDGGGGSGDGGGGSSQPPDDTPGTPVPGCHVVVICE